MGSTGKIRLMIVDDHGVSCEGLVGLFRTVPGIEVAATASEADEAVQLAKQSGPDVVLMNVTLPDHGAFRAAERILTCCSRTRVVFMDDSVHHANACEAVRVGGAGYWTRNATFDEITEAVRRAAAGHLTFCPAIQSQLTWTPTGPNLRPMLDNSVLGKLSPRQTEVLIQLAKGLSVKQCAQRMQLSCSAVDNYKSRLMKKLGVHKTVDLVRLAVREGLVAD